MTARPRRSFLSIDETLTRPLTLPPRRGAAQLLALGLAHSGDSYFWVGLLAAAWLLGDARWKWRALVGFAGLVLAEIAVIAIKMIVRRRRPPGTGGAIYRRVDPYSFPSGHAARATILSLIAWHLGPMAAFIAISAWGPFMVLSRIAIGIHYVFDVIAGVILGGILTVVLLLAAEAVAARL